MAQRVKPLLWDTCIHIEVSVQVLALLLPDCEPGKTIGDGTNIGAPALVYALVPDFVLAKPCVMDIWGVNRQMEECVVCIFTSLCHSFK